MGDTYSILETMINQFNFEHAGLISLTLTKEAGLLEYLTDDEGIPSEGISLTLMANKEEMFTTVYECDAEDHDKELNSAAMDIMFAMFNEGLHEHNKLVSRGFESGLQINYASL